MFEQLLESSLLGNKVYDYVIAAVILVAGIVMVRIFSRIVLAHLRRQAEKTATSLDDFLVNMAGSTLVPVLYFGSFYIATQSLLLPVWLVKAIHVAGILVLTLFGIRFLVETVKHAVLEYGLPGRDAETSRKSLRGVAVILNILLSTIGVIFILDNLGFQVSSAVAGLGIGGIAVALAAQTVLRDLFSYFSILFDRPFEAGDYIAIGDTAGTVEHIGLKSTRIRSPDGHLIVMSNADITASHLANYKSLQKRRVVLRFLVPHDTRAARLKELPELAAAVIGENPTLEFERAHVLSVEQTGLACEVCYYVLGDNWLISLDLRQDVILALKQRLEERGIHFAIPSQAVFLTKTPGAQ